MVYLIKVHIVLRHDCDSHTHYTAYSQSVSPLATAGKVSAANLSLTEQKRNFFVLHFGPLFLFHDTVSTGTFKGYIAMQPPSLYQTA